MGDSVRMIDEIQHEQDVNVSEYNDSDDNDDDNVNEQNNVCLASRSFSPPTTTTGFKMGMKLSPSKWKKKKHKNNTAKNNVEEIQAISSDDEDGLNHAQRNRFTSHGDDDDDIFSIGTHTTNNVDLESSRLSTIVWKRKKSGFSSLIKSSVVKASKGANTLGMKSVNSFQKLIKVNNSQNVDLTAQSASGAPTKLWERRRIVLEGGILMYFHEDADMNVIDENDDHEGTRGNFSVFSHKVKTKFMVFSHATAQSLHIPTSDNGEQFTKSAINTPRGLIDLVALNASASVGHFGPGSYLPTPYSLSIIVKNETKWVVCFNSSKELMTWLGALTEISVKNSAISYRLDHDGETFDDDNGNDEISKDVDVSTESERSRGLQDCGETTPIKCKNITANPSQSDNSTTGVSWSIFSLRLKHIVIEKYQDSYSAMAIINGVIFTFLMMTNTSMVSTFLALQTVANGLACYYLSHHKKIKRQTKKNIPEQSSDTNRSSIMMSPSGKPSRKETSYVEVVQNEGQYKPKAGNTLIRWNDPAEALHRKDTSIAWVSASSSIINLRGAGYLADKKKVPSPTSLYELIEVDAFDSDEHMLGIGNRFELPEVKFSSKHGNWRAPHLLVISFALPTTPPKLGKASDGKGYIVVGYYRMREETRLILEVVSNPTLNRREQEAKIKEIFPNPRDQSRVNGIRLWERWCHSAPKDQEMQKRLKFIPRGENLKEIGVPSWICKYNGKPMVSSIACMKFVWNHHQIPNKVYILEVNQTTRRYQFCFSTPKR
jgi:hypothetical protein